MMGISVELEARIKPKRREEGLAVGMKEKTERNMRKGAERESGGERYRERQAERQTAKHRKDGGRHDGTGGDGNARRKVNE